MFLGCGVAAYSTAIFHLMTHAFFKALFFLGAGSVIHALGGEQDLRKMGGLRKKIPITFLAMTAPVLAITGIPPFSGFFSKDAILYEDFLQGGFGKTLWFVGLVAALLTSFYIFRLWYLAFLGESRNPEAHPHESPWTMLGPLVILALLSLAGGWSGIHRFAAYLSPSDGPLPEGGNTGLEYLLSALAVAVALIGWYIADYFYRRSLKPPGGLPPHSRPPTNSWQTSFTWTRFTATLSSSLCWHFRSTCWSGLSMWRSSAALAWLLAGIATLGGAILQRWQSGNLRSYAAWLALGAAVLLVFVFAPCVVRRDWNRHDLGGALGDDSDG